MMEVGKAAIIDTGTLKEVDINLDYVAAENHEVLGHIYNIVRARRDILGQPARFGERQPIVTSTGSRV